MSGIVRNVLYFSLYTVCKGDYWFKFVGFLCVLACTSLLALELVLVYFTIFLLLAVGLAVGSNAINCIGRLVSERPIMRQTMIAVSSTH